MAQRFADWREARRFRALELSQKGWGPTQIADALGVSKSAVSQWLTRARTHGPEALRAQPRPTGPRRLSRDDEARLPGLLAQGAEAHGFEGERWTRRRVARLIQREFGVRYSVWQVGRILHRQGLSLQKPVLRAKERDEEAIARWRAETLPALQKKGSR